MKKKTPNYIFSEFLLLPDEKVIFRTHPHWLVLAGPEVCVGILTVLLIKYLPILLQDVDPALAWKIWLILGGSLAFAAVMIFLGWLFINYYLTNLRLIDKRGIIGKKIMSIPLKRIQDVKCQFGIWGRIFGFGDLEIESAGTYGKITFDFIPSPREFKERVIQAVKNYAR
jgi:uncharacterized membrane protein YdbT with pleckstrin-like domain